LAPSAASPHGLEEAEWATFGVGAVMLAHDRLDGLSGLIGVVERNGGDIMVKNVGLNDAVEKLTSNETEFTVDSCGSSTGISPGLSIVVRKSWVSVLEVGDSNYFG
jgi:hypothetical protein